MIMIALGIAGLFFAPWVTGGLLLFWAFMWLADPEAPHNNAEGHYTKEQIAARKEYARTHVYPSGKDAP